jgi:hypothetical protein
VEGWNGGFLKEIIYFKRDRQSEFYPLPNIAISQDPFFQYFSIPPFQLGRSSWLVFIAVGLSSKRFGTDASIG